MAILRRATRAPLQSRAIMSVFRSATSGLTPRP
jgi:hypothetical protein